MVRFILNWNFVLAALCAVAFLINKGVRSEIFTSVAEMEGLLDTESVLITNLELYIEAQEEKLDILRQ